VKRSTSKGSEFFVHDNWHIVLTLDKNSSVTNKFLWGAKQNELIAQNSAYTLCDHLGTVRDLISNGIAAHFEYNAFGQLLSKIGNTDCVFKYTGKMTDEVTSLQWNINRWYDANNGKWISEDPIRFWAGDMNLGRYAKNMVVLYKDFMGLWMTGHTIPTINWGTIPESDRYPGTLSPSTIGTKKCPCGYTKSYTSTTILTESRLIKSTDNICINGTYDGFFGDTAYLYCGVFSLNRIVETTIKNYQCTKPFITTIPQSCSIVSGYIVCSGGEEKKQDWKGPQITFDGTAEPMNSTGDPGDILTLAGTVITIVTLIW
jgi:RHS repeat-associated protein